MFFSGENSLPEKNYLCASYTRLSQDDGDKEESNSIVNQKSLIRDFMVNHAKIHQKLLQCGNKDLVDM